MSDSESRTRGLQARPQEPGELLYRTIIENISEGILIRDAGGRIIAANPAAGRILGIAREQLIGCKASDQPWTVLREDGSPWPAEAQPARVTLRTGERQADVIMGILRPDASRAWVCAMSLAVDLPRPHAGGGAVCAFADITARVQGEQERVRLAQYDTLTGLPNLALLRDRLKHAIARAKRNGTLLAVMFLDLDNFREINDSAGHAVGDQVLKEAARRLRSCLRDADTVARPGGDEFTILLESTHNVGEIALLAQRLLDALAQPARLAGRELYFSTSIGISVYPLDDHDAQTLLKNADLAMDHAKQEGRNNYQFFAHEMGARTERRAGLQTRLRRALERGEFMLHYQPQLDIANNRIVGVEALVRWQNDELGMVPPGQFIPIAEETGLIIPLGEWVLRTACAQMRAWQAQGHAPPIVAVNLSPRQFRQKNLVKSIDAILRESGLDAGSLGLEITEGMVMHHTEGAIVTLNALHALGVQISVDDFGTGYSSLAYLQRFPVHTLKVDQSFVRDIRSDRNGAVIVTTIIALAKHLGLKTLAEGVETQEQLLFLQANGCDAYQGYLYSRPRPAAEIAQLLAQNITR